MKGDLFFFLIYHLNLRVRERVESSNEKLKYDYFWLIKLQQCYKWTSTEKLIKNYEMTLLNTVDSERLEVICHNPFLQDIPCC